MTKDEALRLALDTLKEVREETFRLMRNGERLYAEDKVWNTIYVIKEVLAQTEQDNAYTYASNLAKALWQKHYMKESPKFALLDTTKGVLTQIDNMTCGLVRETAQPMQEPVAWEQFHEHMAGPNYVAPQRTWVGLKDDDEIPWDGVDAKSFARAIEAKLKDKNGY